MSSKAEELLNDIMDDDAELGDAYLGTMVLGENPYDDLDPHVVIGEDRFITVPQRLKRIAVEHDHDVETVTFDCPRYWDGRDLSTMKIYINYLRGDKQPGSYPVDNGVTIDPVDSNIIHFEWVITKELTEFKGNISFLVCAKKVDSDGLDVNHWNSELNRDMYVSEGLETVEYIADMYPDLITYLLTRMDIVENKTTLQAMLGYLDTYFTTDAEINEVLMNYVTEYLTSNDEITQTVVDTINRYIAENLSTTDKTLTVSDMVADAAATGDAIRNTLKVTNDTSVNDSVAGPLKLNKLFGKSVQEKTSGKNLVSTIPASKTEQSVSFTLNGDGTIVVDGTSTGYAFASSVAVDATDLVGKTVVLLGAGKDSNVVTQVQFQDANGTKIQNITCGNYDYVTNTVPEGTTLVKYDVYVSEGNTASQVKVYPYLAVYENVPITKADYEPYTGGVASPNPEFPQPIVSAGADGIISGKVVGKNLLNLASVREHSSTAKGYDVKLPAGTYTFSCVNTEQKRLRIFYEDGTYIDAIDWNTAKVKTFVAEKAIKHIQVNINSGTIDLSAWRCQLEKGNKVTDYEPYAECPIAVPITNGLPGIPVTDATLVNYVDADGQMWCCDEIDFERGALVKRVHHVVITEDLTVTRTSQGVFLIDESIPTNGKYNSSLFPENIRTGWGSKAIALSDKFTNIITGDVSNMDLNSYSMGVYVKDGRGVTISNGGASLEELKSILPISLYYILATPIETPLTPEQLNAVKDLMAGEGSTTIFFDNITPGIEMEYPRTLAASYTLQNQKDLKIHNNPYREVVMTDENVITIDDAAAGGLKVIDIFGKSVQETRYSPNLLDLRNGKSGTGEGVTYTNLGDGSYTTSGTATGSAGNVWFLGNWGIVPADDDSNVIMTLKAGKTYRIIDCYLYSNKDNIADMTTPTSDVKITGVRNGHQVAGETYNRTRYPRVFEGWEDFGWQPYTAGQTPNPEFPEPIVSAGESLIPVKNLYGGTFEQGGYDGALNKVTSNYRVRSVNTTPVSPDETYTISSNVAKSIALYPIKTDGGHIMGSWVELPYTFTTRSDVIGITFALKIDDSTSITPSMVNDLMLNKGSVALPYTPYADGEVMKILDIGIEYKVTGKNLLKNPISISNTFFGVTFTRNADGSITRTGTGSSSGSFILYDKFILPEGNYVMTKGIIVRIYDDNGNTLSQHNSTNPSFHVAEGQNVEVSIWISSGTTYSDVVYPMIEKGDVATDYEPYTEQTLTLNRVLRGIPVTDSNLATYTDENGKIWRADYGDVERKVWIQRIGIHQITNVANLDSSGKLFADKDVNEMINHLKTNVSPSIMCNEFTPSSLEKARKSEYGITVYGRTFYIANKDWNFDVATANADLSQNPLTVYYPLATPIETPMTDEEIIAIHSLKTNHGINHIHNGDDVNPTMRFRYGVTDVAGLSLENSNLNAVNEALLSELNNALPFKIVIDDAAGTINFIDR